jgi:hypothetical protein
MGRTVGMPAPVSASIPSDHLSRSQCEHRSTSSGCGSASGSRIAGGVAIARSLQLVGGYRFEQWPLGAPCHDCSTFNDLLV